jgi:hypothetical protein
MCQRAVMGGDMMIVHVVLMLVMVMGVVMVLVMGVVVVMGVAVIVCVPPPSSASPGQRVVCQAPASCQQDHTHGKYDQAGQQA